MIELIVSQYCLPVRQAGRENTAEEVINMYTQEAFANDCQELFRRVEGNSVDIPGRGIVTLYDMPLIGYAAASDPIFEQYRQPEIIGSNFCCPSEWLSTTKTVVSFFFPFTETVRLSNRADKTEPSAEWLYGRIEGQAYISRFTAELRYLLEARGIEVCVPSSDERFGIQFETLLIGGEPDFHANSRWSERHAAYAAGLGTLGLSRGLISEKGMAGRYASVIISEEWPATERRYTGVDDYCIRCGACARKCPAHAISPGYGKNNILCNAHVEKMKEKYPPRYGCGKCQVGVPCEFRAPGLIRKMR